MKYEDKLKQCNHECFAAVVGLVLTIVVWVLCGFCLSEVDVVIFSTPIWIVAGLFGTFLFACAFAVVFAKVIMKDVDLENEDDVDVM